MAAYPLYFELTTHQAREKAVALERKNLILPQNNLYGVKYGMSLLIKSCHYFKRRKL